MCRNLLHRLDSKIYTFSIAAGIFFLLYRLSSAREVTLWIKKRKVYRHLEYCMHHKFNTSLLSRARPSSSSTVGQSVVLITQQTFVLMKTSWRRLSYSSSEDVLIKTNMFALALRLQKTSWSRPIYLPWPYVFKTSSGLPSKISSRRFQGIPSS